jgi:hypothetical protein
LWSIFSAATGADTQALDASTAALDKLQAAFDCALKSAHGEITACIDFAKAVGEEWLKQNDDLIHKVQDQLQSMTTELRKQIVGYYVTIGTAGSGPGTVTPDVHQIAYPFNSTLTLNAVPVTDHSVFDHWEGACAPGSAPVCQLRVTKDLSTTAVFKGIFGLSVGWTGTGGGAVTHDVDPVGTGASGGSTSPFLGTGDVGKTLRYIDGTVVTLTAFPNGISDVLGWFGDCKTPSCSFKVTSDMDVIPLFVPHSFKGTINAGSAEFTDRSGCLFTTTLTDGSIEVEVEQGDDPTQLQAVVNLLAQPKYQASGTTGTFSLAECQQFASVMYQSISAFDIVDVTDPPHLQIPLTDEYGNAQAVLSGAFPLHNGDAMVLNLSVMSLPGFAGNTVSITLR